MIGLASEEADNFCIAHTGSIGEGAEGPEDVVRKDSFFDAQSSQTCIVGNRPSLELPTQTPAVR